MAQLWATPIGGGLATTVVSCYIHFGFSVSWMRRPFSHYQSFSHVMAKTNKALLYFYHSLCSWEALKWQWQVMCQSVLLPHDDVIKNEGKKGGGYVKLICRGGTRVSCNALYFYQNKLTLHLFALEVYMAVAVLLHPLRSTLCLCIKSTVTTLSSFVKATAIMPSNIANRLPLWCLCSWCLLHMYIWTCIWRIRMCLSAKMYLMHVQFSCVYFTESRQCSRLCSRVWPPCNGKAPHSEIQLWLAEEKYGIDEFSHWLAVSL